MEPFSLIAGALILAAGYGAGTSRERRKAKSNPTWTAHTCACGHGLAFHDPETKDCYGKNAQDENGEWLPYSRRNCTCRQYDGPPNLDNVDWSKVEIPKPSTDT